VQRPDEVDEMDHLPQFRYATEPYPRIPLLSLDLYDGLGFEDYPERQSFNGARLRAGDFSEHPPAKTAAFLQSWLVFGILYEIYQPCQLDDFIEEDQDGCRVTTKNLDSVITAWISKVKFFYNSSEEQLEGAARIEIEAKLFDIVLFNRLWRDLSIAVDNPVLADVLLSFAIFGATIEQSLQWRFGPRSTGNWGLARHAEERMKANLWCPRDIAVASYTLSELPMFCTSYIQRQPETFDRRRCTSLVCELNQVNEHGYKSKHTTEDCRCDHLSPSREDILRILLNGDTPVIIISTPDASSGSAETLRLNVVNGSKFRIPYIAVSHV
jgi:hypothetical protein